MKPARGRHQRFLIEADDQGLVSLERFGFTSMQLLAEVTDDGGVVIHPAIAMTPAEAAEFGDPEAVRMVEEARAAARTRRAETFAYRGAGSES
jgi:hypothetical protein